MQIQMQISKNLSTQKQLIQLKIVSNECDRPSTRTYLVMDMNREWFWEIKLWKCLDSLSVWSHNRCSDSGIACIFWMLNGIQSGRAQCKWTELNTNVHFVSYPDYKLRNIFKSQLDYIIYMIYGMCVAKIQFYSTWIFAGILVINTHSIVKL